MEVESDLVFNFMLDMRKKEIDPFKRAKMIQEYMKEKNLSQRALADKLGIPKSTIQDWCLWTRIDKDEYKEMKSNGLNDTKIYRVLRDNKKEDKSVILSKTDLDFDLQHFHRKLKPHISRPTYSEKTLGYISDLVNDLNRLTMRIEKSRS